MPWSKDQVQPVDPADLYPHDAEDAQVFEQGPFGITATAVESRSGDANGQNLRVMGGSGRDSSVRSNIGGIGDVVSLTPLPVLGAMPALDESAKTPFRPNVRCETQEPPSLEGGLGCPTAFNAAAARARSGDRRSPGRGADRFRSMVELIGRPRRCSPAHRLVLTGAIRRRHVDLDRRSASSTRSASPTSTSRSALGVDAR